MLTAATIQQAVDRMVAAAQSPTKIILFGSYATGRAQDSSDLDLLVVEDHIDSLPAEYSRLRQALGDLGVGVDLLIYPQHEFEKRRNWQTSPVFDAVRQGGILYERTHQGSHVAASHTA